VLHFKVTSGKSRPKWRCRDLQEQFGTVPHLFAFLHHALAAKHESIDAEFDPGYGYALRVFIDFGTVDFFEGFSVSAFRDRSEKGR
jgi:hypothetical protein